MDATRAAEYPLVGAHVLVIDDDDDFRCTLHDVLECLGARVTSSASAAEARRVLARIHPDVILSDISMPGEDGFMFIRRLRAGGAAAASIPAAAMTAQQPGSVRAKALASGFSFVLAKPMGIDTVTDAVLALCKQSSGVGETVHVAHSRR